MTALQTHLQPVIGHGVVGQGSLPVASAVVENVLASTSSRTTIWMIFFTGVSICLVGNLPLNLPDLRLLRTRIAPQFRVPNLEQDDDFIRLR